MFLWTLRDILRGFQRLPQLGLLTASGGAGLFFSRPFLFDSRTPVQFTELINLGLFINRSIFSWIGSAALADQAPATYIATLARRIGKFVYESGNLSHGSLTPSHDAAAAAVICASRPRAPFLRSETGGLGPVWSVRAGGDRRSFIDAPRTPGASVSTAVDLYPGLSTGHGRCQPRLTSNLK